ncbi:MAG: hypothetical protein JWP89_1556 [Schlesneria sp.]|nr:hypothetical protein [Schlesneria sp.]
MGAPAITAAPTAAVLKNWRRETESSDVVKESFVMGVLSWGNDERDFADADKTHVQTIVLPGVAAANHESILDF